jgi:hypothetical protein
LNLKKKKKRQRDIYDPDRPAPDVGKSREQDGNDTRDQSEKFKIAYGIIPGSEENIIDIEEIHISICLPQVKLSLLYYRYEKTL